MPDLFTMFIFLLVVALALTILGVREAAMSIDIAKIIGAVIIVLILLTVFFGTGVISGFHIGA